MRKKIVLGTAAAFLLFSGSTFAQKIAKEKFCNKKWKVTETEIGGKKEKADPSDRVTTYMPDGTFVIEEKGKKKSYTYKYDEATNTITGFSGDQQMFTETVLTVEGKKMTATYMQQGLSAPWKLWMEAK